MGAVIAVMVGATGGSVADPRSAPVGAAQRDVAEIDTPDSADDGDD